MNIKKLLLTLTLIFTIICTAGCGNKTTKREYPGDATITLDNYREYFSEHMWSEKKKYGTERVLSNITELYETYYHLSIDAYFTDIAQYDVSFTFETFECDLVQKNFVWHSKPIYKSLYNDSALKLDGNGLYHCFIAEGYKIVRITDVKGTVTKINA